MSDTPADPPSNSAVNPEVVRSLSIGAAVTVVMMVVLKAMGRVWWCQCGRLDPWSSDIWSLHNSQHLADPYLFSHVLHGVLFYGALRLVLGADRLVIRSTIAMILEAAWEIAENTPMVINRYREATISLDYFGDSVINSAGDLWACALGFWITRKLPWWGSVALFVAFEVLLLVWIRDSLIVNIIMLVAPIDGIREWQMAGAPTG